MARRLSPLTRIGRWVAALAGAVALLGLTGLVSLLPAAWAEAMGRGLGWLWWRCVPVRRATARRQLEAALGPDGPALGPAVFAHLGQHLIDFLRQGLGRPSRLPVEIRGLAHLEAALAKGRGALIITAHLGPWERLIAVADAASRSITVVSQQLSHGILDRMWWRRRGQGVRFAPDRGLTAARTLIERLGQGEAVALTLDQHHAGARAAVVPFFARAAATSTSPARLSRRTGAPLVPIFARWTSTALVVEVHPEIDPPGEGDAALWSTTAALTAQIEAAIRQAPEQWLWIHRRWKAADRGQAVPQRSTEATDSAALGRQRSLDPG